MLTDVGSSSSLLQNIAVIFLFDPLCLVNLYILFGLYRLLHLCRFFSLYRFFGFHRFISINFFRYDRFFELYKSCRCCQPLNFVSSFSLFSFLYSLSSRFQLTFLYSRNATAIDSSYLRLGRLLSEPLP
jgi:hypothetical protein